MPSATTALASRRLRPTWASRLSAAARSAAVTSAPSPTSKVPPSRGGAFAPAALPVGAALVPRRPDAGVLVAPARALRRLRPRHEARVRHLGARLAVRLGVAIPHLQHQTVRRHVAAVVGLRDAAARRAAAAVHLHRRVRPEAGPGRLDRDAAPRVVARAGGWRRGGEERRRSGVARRLLRRCWRLFRRHLLRRRLCRRRLRDRLCGCCLLCWCWSFLRRRLVRRHNLRRSRLLRRRCLLRCFRLRLDHAFRLRLRRGGAWQRCEEAFLCDGNLLGDRVGCEVARRCEGFAQPAASTRAHARSAVA